MFGLGHSNRQKEKDYPLRFANILQRVMQRDNITGKVFEIYQGPMTFSYLVRLYSPTMQQIRLFKELGSVLEKVGSVSPVRIVDRGTHYAVEIPSNEPKTPHASWLMDRTFGANIAIGVNPYGEPVHINMKHHPTILFVGPTRKGKTEAMRSVLASILASDNHPSFLIFSQKAESWRGFNGKRGFLGLYADVEVAKSVLEKVADIMGELAESGEKTKPVLLVLDDLTNLLVQEPGIVEPLVRLASTGGEVGVYLLVATQSAGSKRGTGSLAFEDNISARVIYRSASALSASRATGYTAEGVSHLSGLPGDALVYQDGMTTRCATAYLREEDLEKVPVGETRYDRESPWYGVVQEVFHVKQAKTPNNKTDLPQVNPPRPLSATEAEKVRRAAQSMSLNGIVKEVFGYKNGMTVQYVKDALRGGLTDNPLQSSDSLSN